MKRACNQTIILTQKFCQKLFLFPFRQFVLVNEYGTFMSLRKFPNFAHIKQTITEKDIVLEAPGMPLLRLPLEMTQADGDHCTDVT